jgi:hypothetical protein
MNKPFYAECLYSECRYAECRGADLKVVKLSLHFKISIFKFEVF